MDPERFSTNVRGMECPCCGKLKFSVAHHPQARLVRLTFGKPEKWMLMAPDIALHLSHALHDHAMDCLRPPEIKEQIQ